MVEPRIATFLAAVKQAEAKEMPLGAVGVAWGGYFVVRACGSATTVLDAAFLAHPSNLTYPRDVERISVPMSWAAAETCRHMSPAQAEMTRKILAAKSARAKDEDEDEPNIVEDEHEPNMKTRNGSGKRMRRFQHEFVLYGGVNYGFAQGATRKKIKEAEAGERAEEQAVEWFRRRSNLT